ncbi:uncharacterized protein DSM5745_08541 [Aspergillus mulundensis]|uniref:Uncharacterized protein n=1 Tax=Aspergillus mulundensis TaxID=1810919 RepID=A0A3D8R4C8_9EURO|nr:hypothetical protein DSM5745_08541 [Aspergillus mulundensis]RDW68781.1 hypothetical protein DSM5745_08541 [Aspergillus mulundensis]
MSDPSLHNFKAHATTAVAAGGAVYAANQLVKSFEDEDEAVAPHLLKAGVGAAVAIGALEMLRRDDGSLATYRRLFDKHERDSHTRSAAHRHSDTHVHQSATQQRSDTLAVTTTTSEHEHEHHAAGEQRSRQGRASTSSSRSRSSSSSRDDEHGHNRRLAEELVAAYSLGKQLLGDKKHEVVHLVADAVGATALLKEINYHDLRNK